MKPTCDLSKYALGSEMEWLNAAEKHASGTGSWASIHIMPTSLSGSAKRGTVERIPKCPIPEIVMLAEYNTGVGSNSIAQKHSVSRFGILRSLETLGLRRTRQAAQPIRGLNEFMAKPAFSGDWTGSVASIAQDLKANKRYEYHVHVSTEKARERYYANHEKEKVRARDAQRKRTASMTKEERTALYGKRNRNARVSGYCRKWRAKNKAKVRAMNAAYKKRNPEKIKLWRRTSDRKPANRLVHNIRGRMRELIKYRGRAIRPLIGCSTSFLREHIESQFRDGMTWENYGPTGWHLDHKRPLSSFDLTDFSQVQEANHWTNLQPLWWHENLAKSDKWECAT